MRLSEVFDRTEESARATYALCRWRKQVMESVKASRDDLCDAAACGTLSPEALAHVIRRLDVILMNPEVT